MTLEPINDSILYVSEFITEPSPERRQIDREIVSLQEGPIDIELCRHKLRIVNPIRDLGEREYNVDYIVIDPSNYDPTNNRGYKGLWDGQDVVLGRDSTYDRFKFSDYVSRQHVLLRRDGEQLVIEDLNSTNGTYLTTKEAVVHPKFQRYGEITPTKEGYIGVVELAGYSVASDSHPNRNEDAFFIDETSKALGVFDGVGGAKGSELASQLASKAVKKYLDGILPGLPISLSRLAMYEALNAGHEAIINGAQGTNIATTAAVAKIFETEKGNPFVVVASVGDSRIYLFRDSQLDHLTLDHAIFLPGQDEKDAKLMQMTLAEATDLSKLTKEEQNAFHNRNIISSCLGNGSNNRPFISVDDFEVRKGDRILITSDGIHDNLTNSEIKAILQQKGSSNDVVNELVTAARSRSKDSSHIRAKADDMTAVILSL